MLSFGSDPEFMLGKNGSIYSAIGIVPGSRKNRYRVNGHEFYYDNVLAECAIKPGYDKEETLFNFQECFQQYAQIVQPFKLIPQAFQEYPKSQLKTKEAVIAGCKDETCAYTMMQKVPPQMVIKYSQKRSAGGHIHLGKEGWVRRQVDIFPIGVWDAAKALDFFVGLPSVLMDIDKTTIQRKELYGHAGRFRKTDYGIEYRSLGNFWLASPKLVSMIHDLCVVALDFIEDEDNRNLFWNLNEDMLEEYPPNAYTYKCDIENIRKAITEHDAKLSASLFAQFKKWIPKKLYKEITSLKYSKEYDFYKEWHID